jgi:uncharacterized protein (TIGR02270 family)
LVTNALQGMKVIIRPLIPVVIQQHAEDAAMLWNTRSVLLFAPHATLQNLGRYDDRLQAQFNGLDAAVAAGLKLATAGLESLERGNVFTMMVMAIESCCANHIEKLIAATESSPCCHSGIVSAFGWVSAASSRVIAQTLLASLNPFRRMVALTACALHQLDPGTEVVAALNDENLLLRSRALRVVATLALLDHLPACLNALTDEDPDCSYQAARAAVLLGDRGASIAALRRIALAPSPRRSRALRLLLKLQSPSDAHATLKALAQDPACARLLIQGVGTAGDSHYVPWLIQQMQDLKLSRLAGESFSFITGLDLAYLDLERKPPEGVDFGPNDDPNDDNVAMDEDESLPWPDVEKITAWWEAHGHRFAPGTRYFMGEPPSSAHCLDVLKNGFQRQRMAAAIHLCLLKPGTPLFNCAAPAWRQQRLLATMVA